MKDFKVIKKIPEILKIAAINLALLLVFLELGSLGWYFVKHKQFFYTRDKAENKSALGMNLEGVRLNQSIVERFHPFFGFIQNPSPDFRPGFKVNKFKRRFYLNTSNRLRVYKIKSLSFCLLLPEATNSRNSY